MVGSTPSRSSSEIRSTCSRIPESSLDHRARPPRRSSSSRASRATCRTCSRSITAAILGRRRRAAAGAAIRGGLGSRDDDGGTRRALRRGSACDCSPVASPFVGLLFIAVPDGTLAAPRRPRRLAARRRFAPAPETARAALARARLRLHGRDHGDLPRGRQPTSSVTGRCCWCSRRARRPPRWPRSASSSSTPTSSLPAQLPRRRLPRRRRAAALVARGPDRTSPATPG